MYYVINIVYLHKQNKHCLFAVSVYINHDRLPLANYLLSNIEGTNSLFVSYCTDAYSCAMCTDTHSVP